MKTKKTKSKIIIQFIILLAIFIVTAAANFAVGFFEKLNADSYHDRIILSSKWKAIVNGNDLGEVVLSDTRFEMFNKGDEIIVSTCLPEKMPDHPVLELYNIHSTIIVSIDGVVRYAYGHEYYENNRLLGYGYHYVPLGEYDAGKEMVITEVVTENSAFSNIQTPVIASSVFLIRDTLNRNLVRISAILFTILFGISLFIVALFFSFKNKGMIKLMSVGIFAISIGAWSFCTTDLIELFSYNLQLKTILEYSSLYLSSFFVMLYFWNEICSEGKVRKVIYQTLVGLDFLFVLSAFILQALQIVHFPAMLSICHALMALMIVFMVTRFVIDLIKDRIETSAIIYGFEVMVMFTVDDLVRYNFRKFFPIAQDDHYVSLVYVGVVIFVITMIIDYAVKYIKGVYERAAKDALEKMAYTDSLTGLANRRALEEAMDLIDKTGEAYCVVGFDLNDLKRVNDSKGHDVGDEYIKEFSNALEQVLGSKGMVTRTGGDEFTALLSDMTGDEALEVLEGLEERICHINAAHSDWGMSTAYGVCSSKEEDVKNVRDASKKADERMYARKAEMKAFNC